ncbi:MAG: hypothetical protein M1308_09925, partial [Actinobacteria bacterium]|nr:hypothetical protein [Actinomycetota bacterium]
LVCRKNYERLFDLDYWGLSYKEGIEYILENDPGDKIKIAMNCNEGEKVGYILDKKERDRLVFVENIQEADYLLANFRCAKEFPYNDKFYSIIINGNTVMTIFKLNNN